MRAAVAVTVLVATSIAVSACSSSGTVTVNRTSSSEAPAPSPSSTVAGSSFDVAELGLTFRLPQSFGAVADADYAFLARSTASRALFSIDGADTSIVDAEPRTGESLSPLDLSGVDAVVVTNAALEGLPAGISANELLVGNGDRSFSVIMSAPTVDLPGLWDVFLRSLVVTPDG